MGTSPEMLEKFRTKAKAVSATVVDVSSMAQAIAYTVDLCSTKEACQLLMSGCDESLSDKGKDLCELKEWKKIIAAPALEDADMAELIAQARERRWRSSKTACATIWLALISVLPWQIMALQKQGLWFWIHPAKSCAWQP